MSFLEHKLIKKKKLDKELNLQVLLTYSSERFIVEFFSKDRRMVLQKTFQNNFQGKEEMKKFENSFKSMKDLKKYFLKGEKNVVRNSVKKNQRVGTVCKRRR